jgi:hypothetical protein
MPHHWIKSSIKLAGAQYTVTIINEEGKKVTMKIPQKGNYTEPGKKIGKTKVKKIAKAVKKLLNKETT